MCAITGFIEYQKQVDENVLSKMNSVLKHRGPDDTGLMTLSVFDKKKNLAIGFNRLSIRDLSLAGHQPMLNSKEDVIITFNGEIYNADDLRPCLIEKGYAFKSKSDTEVLLHLYEEYGINEMLNKIDGMFAICITDLKRDCIYLIRDRLGEKPLYYYKNSTCLMWASEYKAFYEHPSFSPELEKSNLTEYLMFRYVSEGETLLKGVYNLTPGSYLKITSVGIEKKTYWEFPVDNKVQISDVKKVFNENLEKAYASRMVSDVEVGVQLSGGVDSSCLCEFVSKISSHKLKAFGIVFDGKDYSERKYMEEVATKCNLDLHLYNFTNDIFLQSWIQTSYYFEAPMNHEGTLGLYYLNKEASKLVKAMLCGEGADETMGGYDRFFSTCAVRKSFILRMAYFLRNIFKNKTFDFNLFFNKFDTNFIKVTQFIKNYNIKHIFNNCEIKKVIKKREAILKKMPGTKYRQLMNYETATYCQDLLMRADKVSMASSLELRVPYLSPDLVELENTIPDSYFVSCNSLSITRNTKKLLKDRCCSIFGEDFTYRPKMGFGIPLMDYFARGEVREFIENKILPGIKTRKLFNYKYIKNIYDKYCNTKRKSLSNNSYINMLWVCFSFELWAQLYLDGNPNLCYKNKVV